MPPLNSKRRESRAILFVRGTERGREKRAGKVENREKGEEAKNIHGRGILVAPGACAREFAPLLRVRFRLIETTGRDLSGRS